MFSRYFLSFLGGLLASAPVAYAGFSSSAGNVAVYWGQNSYNQGSGTLAQQRLSYYCANTELNIIPLAFLVSISNPTLNFANSGNACTAISGSSLFYCSEIEADIATCQSTYGKTILLSLGGATYTEGGFSSSAAAIAAAKNIWSIFGPNTGGSSPRPFGNSVVDGFDFDFESTVSNMIPFGQQLRSLMTASSASTGKEYYLTAAPQCPYPDAADGPMLAGQVYFDAIFVQFYNNYCGVQSYTSGTTTQTNFNFATWDNWAKTSSLNPNVKVFIGVPGAASAAGSGYLSATSLAPIIAYAKTFSSFGGVMMWDMSQVYANTGFLSAISSTLGSSASSGSSPIDVPSTPVATPVQVTTPTPTPTTMVTVVVPSTPTPTPTVVSSNNAGTVNQWNQCGGEGWTGGTVCKSPYVCTVYSTWYSMCE